MQQSKISMQGNEYNNFKITVDTWVKKFNRDISMFEQYPEVIEENVENIEHNYELTRELMKEMDNLKQEMKMLRVVQTAMLQKKV